MHASPIPANYHNALADPNWRAAMVDEYKALVANGTWRLVPRPPRANVAFGKWIFKHKHHSNGSLARHGLFAGFLSGMAFMMRPSVRC